MKERMKRKNPRAQIEAVLPSNEAKWAAFEKELFLNCQSKNKGRESRINKSGPKRFFTIALAVGLFSASSVLAQPGVLRKSPADYAYEYDKQLPKPRMTMEEEKLSKRVRQGAFARQLIKTLELEKELPLTASEDDAIRLLNSYGIQPLTGWDRYAPLTDDDYTVVIGKAIGKELLVHQKAQEVCDEIVKLLNVEWALYRAEQGKYAILEKLIRDKSVFPGDEPRCPYGVAYKIGGFKPHVLSHKHIYKSPLKSYLYKERDFFQDSANRGGRKRF